jgi:hypothetical protein
MDSIYQDWTAGRLSDQEAIVALYPIVTAADAAYKQAEAERAAIRARLGYVVAHAGGRAQAPGLGRLLITAPAVTPSYDHRQLDALVIELTQTHPEIAQRIAALRRETIRAGTLRLIPERAAA